MLANELYDFIAERSMSREFNRYFQQLPEEQQIMVGLELLALRTWTVSHTINKLFGQTQDWLISDIERQLIQDCGDNLFQFIALRCTSYGGYMKLPSGMQYVSSMFKSNIQQIHPGFKTIPDDEIQYMIDLFLQAPREIIKKYV